MIISISGKAGSGKDTVGSIIQYLTTATYHKKISYDEWVNKWNSDVGKSTWEIKKYSDKLKDMVCLLLGCTREQLEDQEFKETPLGKEWTKWGIVRPNGTRVIDIQSSYEKAFERKETVWQDGSTIKEIQLTPRMILQLIGTEGGRDLIHPDIWVNTLFADYTSIKTRIELALYDSSTGKYIIPEGHGEHTGKIIDSEFFQYNCESTYPNWIITDSRFPNDVKRTKELGGICIRVNRSECEGRKDEHGSETALDHYTEWDHVIENNGTIEELVEQVRSILKKENII